MQQRGLPYNVKTRCSTTTSPATLFVPMFAPDETDNTFTAMGAPDNWWNDVTESRGADAPKVHAEIFHGGPNGTSAASGDEGPNASCTTKPITTLTDVSVTAGKTAIKTAIDAMSPAGDQRARRHGMGLAGAVERRAVHGGPS